MRFAFADLKKTIHRRGGEPHIVPFLLRPGQLTRELADVIALYEHWLGRERADFPVDRVAVLVGDYRLARCLDLCLGAWYEWRSPEWPGPASATLAAALLARGIASASQLRVALFDCVNAHFDGYLGAAERDRALADFGADLGIPPPILDLLLALDTDAEAILCRTTSSAPPPEALAVRYNQQALEVMLANAARVEWVLPAEWSGASGEGLGTVAKRICFLARRLGVYYDLTFADDVGTDGAERDERATDDATIAFAPRASAETEGSVGARGLPLVAEARVPYGAATTPLDACGRSLVVTLYGPQELSSAPTQYGERLARLCRALLGYRRAEWRGGHAALAGGALRGSARVYLHGRPLVFVLDDLLPRLLHSPAEPATAVDGALSASEGVPSPESDGALYDSALEAQLYTEFADLEAIGETHGWHLEHEPMPLLAEDVILIPDFALSRGDRRVFLELAGYWRPGYRERKVRKLAALRGRVDFILAAPAAAREEFAALGAGIELLWYDDHVGVQALLALLDHAFNDFDARLAALDAPTMRAEVAARGRIAPEETQRLLGAYSRAELAALTRALEVDADESAPVWVEGVGLCAHTWLARAWAQVRAEVASTPDGSRSLEALWARLAAASPELVGLSASAVESLAAGAGMLVHRDSLFAVQVSLAEACAVPPEAQSGGMSPAGGSRPAQPRRTPRRTHSKDLYATPPLFAPEDANE